MAKEELYEEEEYEEEEEEDEEEELDPSQLIDQELRDIYREMKNWPKTSAEYAALSSRAIDITEQRRNYDQSIRDRVSADEMKRQRYMPIIQTLCNAAGSAVGSAVGQMFNRRTVNDVLMYERDGNIVTSKAAGFIQKPRN